MGLVRRIGVVLGFETQAYALGVGSVSYTHLDVYKRQVQGDRTMGVWEQVKPVWRKNIREVFGFEVPEKKGYDTVNAIRAMHDGKAKVFFSLGGNFLSASPDTNYTAQGLRQCKLTVQISTKLNRSHLVHGEEALILPTLARSDQDIHDGAEQFVTCENSMGVIQASRGVLEPISNPVSYTHLDVYKRQGLMVNGRRSTDF